MSVENKIESLFNVQGLVAVITGGGSGLGSYAAKALDANGAKAVYIVGRREDALHTVAKAAVNGTIKPIVGDVTDKASLSKITDQIREEQGHVNFLFANAGVMGPSDRQALDAISEPSVKDIQEALWKPEPDAYTKALHINVTGAYYTAIAFLDLLDAGNKKRNVPQDSSILITSSIAGYSRHLASSFAYSTSKAAVNHLVKTLSTLFAQQQMHIRVNGVNPGLYPSEMTTASTSKLDKFGGIDGHQGAFVDAHTMASSRCPAGRTGSEQDLAGLVLFFASHAGAYLNGETLISDGGRLAQMPASY